MPISFTSKGDFKRTEKFLNFLSKGQYLSRILDRYGRMGVDALASSTPVESGITAASWGFKTSNNSQNWSITWYNTHVVSGRPLVIMLQYGHATGTGGYVQGRDFINPAIKPIFDKIADNVWKEVTSA